jgi:hypothetical protein
MEPEQPPTEAPDLPSTPGRDPESTRGSASAWMVVALALSFLGLLALTAWTLAPAGGCGGG